jgi:hypothetical protein
MIMTQSSLAKRIGDLRTQSGWDCGGTKIFGMNIELRTDCFVDFHVATLSPCMRASQGRV